MALSKWQGMAEKTLQALLRRARRIPELRRRGPAPSPWAVSVALVSTQDMTRLNRKYRRKAKPTDVLSFPAPNVFFQEGLLGDLVLCAPVMKQQAREQGHAIGVELTVLLAHGLLHLLGFDHEASAAQAARMKRWEVRLVGTRHKKSTLIGRSLSDKTKS